MPKFELSCSVTVSAYTRVKANTLEEAITIAKDREMAIGGIHNRDEVDDVWIVDDIDGLPMNIHE